MALGKGLSSLLPQQKGMRMTLHKETGHAKDGDRIWNIPISEIVPNADQPRKVFSHQELEDLVGSIKLHGILQPILVTEKDDGGYELIAGERRLRAAEIAGLPTVPAIVRTATKQDKLELALIENIQRQDLNPIEEAFAYGRLVEEFGLTQQEVGDRVGKSRPYIANTIRLLGLPEPIQKALMDGALSQGKAKAILSLKSEEDQMKVFHSMMGEAITVRDVEQAVASKGARSRKGFIRQDANILAYEHMLEERLGVKVHMTLRGGRGTILISFYSKEELERVIRTMVNAH